jgi:hypothetical protein
MIKIPPYLFRAVRGACANQVAAETADKVQATAQASWPSG